MDKTSYDIVGDAVSKFWREKCFPMDVVCFFYQKYDYWQDDEWEWREEFASPVSDSDYDKVLFQNDFCEGQSVVKDLVIVPFDEVTGYYTKNVIEKNDKWISVNKQLPAFNDLVLASTKSDYPELKVIITAYNAEEYWFNGAIEAWMPLPKPYIKKEENSD